MISELSPLSSLDDRAKRVVEVARRRAEGLRSRVIGPEHLLLALLAARQDLAARVVTALTGSAADAERLIAQNLLPGLSPSPSHIPFAPACEQLMVRAAQQALLLGDNSIGTEHLLLALLLDDDHPAVRALSHLGVNYQAAQTEITRLRADPA